MDGASRLRLRPTWNGWCDDAIDTAKTKLEETLLLVLRKACRCAEVNGKEATTPLYVVAILAKLSHAFRTGH